MKFGAGIWLFGQFVDRYATDEGLFAPDEIAVLVDRTPFLHEGYSLVTGRARQS